MASDYCVILIVDRAFGEKLAACSSDIPIWIIDSPTNHPVIRRIWSDRKNADHLNGITSFKDKPDEAVEDIAASMLDTIELHHGGNSHNPPWNVLRIIGAQATESLLTEIREFGFRPMNTTEAILAFRR